MDALAQRVLDLEKAGVHLSPMGCAHVFWACATLRVRTAVIHHCGMLYHDIHQTLARHNRATRVCGAQANPKDGALYEAVAQHILEPGVSAGFNHIDLSNIWWACGIMGLNPCAGRLYPLLAQEAINRVPVMNQQVLETDLPSEGTAWTTLSSCLRVIQEERVGISTALYACEALVIGVQAWLQSPSITCTHCKQHD